MEIIALVSRYHRQSPPKRSHTEYSKLSRTDQVLVSKLSALLRVADSLDAALTQRIQKLTVTQKKSHLILTTEGASSITLEQIALSKKGNLFEELFGLKLQLQNTTAL